MKPFSVVPAVLAAAMVVSAGCGTPHLKLHASYVYDTAITVKTPPVVRPNPLRDTRMGNELYDQMVFQTLLSLDPNGQPAPGLAESWSHDPSGTTWHLTLNPYAKWWSGRPVTAQNVAWTLNLYRNPASGFVRTAELTDVAHIDVVSKTTLTIVLKHPDRDFAANILTPRGGLWVLPSFLLARLPATQVGTSRYLTDLKDLVGSGPYRPFKSTPGSLTWVAYPRYFLGTPKTKYLRWVWSENPAVPVDVAATSAPSSRYHVGYRTLTDPGTRLWYLTSTDPLLAKIAKAATNPPSLPGIPAASPSWSHTSAKLPIPESTSLVGILSQNGYHKTRGVWVGAGGSRLLLRLHQPNLPFGRKLARVLESQWRAQGLEVRLVQSQRLANIRVAYREVDPRAERVPNSSQLLVWTPIHWYISNHIADFVPNVWQPFYKAEGWRVRSDRKQVTQ